MEKVISKDGTTIAFDKLGAGPPLILVGGSFEQRAMESETSRLAAQPILSRHFTVVYYDRRGRGDSTDTQPYVVEREVDDIEALIDEVGGTAFVSGISSGAILAMEAAIRLGRKVTNLAMYEAPYKFLSEETEQSLRNFSSQYRNAMVEGRRGIAIAYFLRLLTMSRQTLEGMKQCALSPMCEAMAPALCYDVA